MKIDFKGFSPLTPQRVKSSPCTPSNPTPLSSERKKTISSLTDSSHSPCNKVPTGDSPYLKDKHIQMIEKDISKDVMMKQHNRVDEFIEVIKLFRNLCSEQTQESLDNVLIDLYKRAGTIDEHIELLQHKLQLVEDGVTYGGRHTKIARAQGKKYLCSIEHEKSRLLGNSGWDYMQQENYHLPEEFYRKALSIDPDKNKGRINEAKSLLLTVEPPSVAECELADSFVNSFGRATEMVSELESGPFLKPPDCNLNPIVTCHQLPSVNDIEDNLQRKLEAVGINGEFRKPAARGSLYFDQKKEQEPSVQQYLYSNTHECAGNPSIFSGNDGFGGNSREEDLHEEDFSGTEVHFPYDMVRFGEILRKEQDYAASVTAGVNKKRGTVVILYPYGDETFTASDSRLNQKIEDDRDKKNDQTVKKDEENKTEKNPFKEDEGTNIENQEIRLKGKDVVDEDKKYIICYKQANKDIRCNIEEVGEKILTCERFTVALAGNYSLAHPLCTGLLEKWRKGEKVSDCSLLEPLQKHCKKDKDKETDFVLLTPSDERGRDFDIRYVTHDGTYPVDGLLCFGSGGEFAKNFILKYIKKFRPKSKSDIIEMLKKAVYHISGQEKTVGGMVVITAAKIEKCGMKKKLVTEILKFPAIKPVWNWSISNRLNNLNFPSKYLIEAGENVLDMDIMQKIMLGELDENVIGQNLVRARIYTVGIGPSFYQTSRYMNCEEFHDYYLYLRYNQEQDKFTLGPTPDDDSFDNDSENVYFVDDFQRLRELIIGREYMYWDNEKAIFVIC